MRTAEDLGQEVNDLRSALRSSADEQQKLAKEIGRLSLLCHTLETDLRAYRLAFQNLSQVKP